MTKKVHVSNNRYQAAKKQKVVLDKVNRHQIKHQLNKLLKIKIHISKK